MSPAYLLKRLLLIGYTLFVVSLIVFAHHADPAGGRRRHDAGRERDAGALAALREQARPRTTRIWMQYLHWLGGVLRGDFGVSMRTGQPVAPAMLEALGRSLLLAAVLDRADAGRSRSRSASSRRCGAAGRPTSASASSPMSASRCRNSSPRRWSCWSSPTGCNWLPATGYVPLTEICCAGSGTSSCRC